MNCSNFENPNKEIWFKKLNLLFSFSSISCYNISMVGKIGFEEGKTRIKLNRVLSEINQIIPIV